MTARDRQTDPHATPPGGGLMGITGQPFLCLSEIIRSPLVDRAGERIARVDDLVVHLGSGGSPLVAGLRIGMGRRQVFVSISQVAELSPGRVQLRGETVNLNSAIRLVVRAVQIWTGHS
jgi:hypothetical protein